MIEAAVLAVILDTHTWLEDQPLGEVRSIGALEELGVKHGDERRSQTAQGSLTVGGDDDLIDTDVVRLCIEVHFDDLVWIDLYDTLLAEVAETAHDQCHALLLKVLEEVVPRGIGSRTEGRPLDSDGDTCEMLTSLRICDVPNNVGISRPLLC